MTRNTGNILIGVWKAPFASYPPTSANAMHAGATGPYLVTGAINEVSNLTGWSTVTGVYGEVVTINIDAITGINDISLALKYHQY